LSLRSVFYQLFSGQFSFSFSGKFSLSLSAFRWAFFVKLSEAASGERWTREFIIIINLFFGRVRVAKLRGKHCLQCQDDSTFISNFRILNYILNVRFQKSELRGRLAAVLYACLLLMVTVVG
jgi:hypothetical protein